jgi:hypothetical protein
VLDVMIPQDSALKKHLAGFQHSALPDWGWDNRCRFAFRRHGRHWSEKRPYLPGADGTSRRDNANTFARLFSRLAEAVAVIGRIFEGLLFLGVSRRGLYHAELPLSAVIGSYRADAYHVVNCMSDEIGVHAGADRILAQLSKDVAESVPGSVFDGLVREYQSLVVEQSRKELDDHLGAFTSKQTLPVPASRLIALSPFPGRAPLALLSLSWLIALKAPHLLSQHTLSQLHMGFLNGLTKLAHFLPGVRQLVPCVLLQFAIFLAAITLGTLLLLLGRRHAYHQLRRATTDEARRTLSAWVQASISEVAGSIDTGFMRELTRRLDISLTPRPLQRALLGREE